MHAVVCKFISVSTYAFFTVQSRFCDDTSNCEFIYHAKLSSAVKPDCSTSTSLRNSSKYSSADEVKHCRKLECWQHRCKNVKSRIPYTWLFCWDIQNPVRLQVLTAVTIQTAVFQQGKPRSVVQYKCANLS